MPNTSRFYLAADDGNGVHDLLDIVTVSVQDVIHSAFALKELVWSPVITWPSELPLQNVLIVLPAGPSGAFMLKRELDASNFLAMDLNLGDPRRLILLPKATDYENFQMMGGVDMTVHVYFI
jgi:hypothetical protein